MNNEFVEERFLTYVDNVFIKVLHAFMLDKLDTVRHFMSNDLYNKLNNELSELKSKNLIQMYEMTNVKESKILDCVDNNEKIVITVKLISRYVEYKIEKDTKEITGNNEDRIEKNNILIFEKLKNTKTQKASRKCPNCGANMDISNSGKCEYCGSIYNLEDYDYILTSMQ